MPAWIKWILLTLAGVVAVAYLGVCALLRAVEPRVVFTRDLPYVPPSVSLALNHERVEFGDHDPKFVAWIIPSLPQDRSDNWLLFFHNGRDNLSQGVDAYETFRGMGFNIMAPEYPGYLDAPGEPSEQTIEREAQAAYDYLRNVKNVPAKNIVIFGSALGAAVAIDLASRVEAAALVEHGGSSSLVATGQKRYPLLPISLLTRNKFESDKKIGRVKMPVIILHSGDDDSIPFAQAKQLSALAPAPKMLVQLHGRGPIQTNARQNSNFFPEIATFLNTHAGFRLRQPLPSIAPVFAETLDKSGIAAALAKYRSLLKENPPRYNFRESELNELGYDYIREEQHEEAIAILQLNAEQFPQSFNVYDSLGDAYEAAGRDAEAIESFRKSVAVFPGKENFSRPKLERLERKSQSR